MVKAKTNKNTHKEKKQQQKKKERREQPHKRTQK